MLSLVLINPYQYVIDYTHIKEFPMSFETEFFTRIAKQNAPSFDKNFKAIIESQDTNAFTKFIGDNQEAVCKTLFHKVVDVIENGRPEYLPIILKFAAEFLTKGCIPPDEISLTIVSSFNRIDKMHPWPDDVVFDSLKILLDFSNDMKTKIKAIDPDYDYEGSLELSQPLYMALNAGHYPTIDLLLDSGLDLNSNNPMIMLRIMSAIDSPERFRDERQKMVRYIIGKTTGFESHFEKQFESAIDNHKTSVMNFLISEGYECGPQDVMRAFCRNNSSDEVLEVLLSNGVTVDEVVKAYTLAEYREITDDELSRLSQIADKIHNANIAENRPPSLSM